MSARLRGVTGYVSMTDQLAISTLTLQHRIPDDWAADPWAEVRPLPFRVDILREVHPEGLTPSCRHWTGPAEKWMLAVTREPRRIVITEPTCTAGCCGALYVTVRRGRPSDLGRLGEQQRHHRPARGHHLRRRPVRGRTRAGRSGPQLGGAGRHRCPAARADPYGQRLVRSGGCVLTGVWPRRVEPEDPEKLTRPEGVDVEFHDVQAPGERACSYAYELFVTHDQPLEEQVRQLAARILADDPRKTAELRER